MSVNDQTFSAKRGEVLLDAALTAGIDIPHDCRAGQCGTCQVRVLDGLTYGGESDEPGTVRACQARIITDLEVLVEPVPDVVATRGIVTGLRPLAPDVVEVRISLAQPVDYLPGQYYKFQFRGYPPRCFSPTAPMAPGQKDGGIRLHVRRMPGGRVSSALGAQIGIGHPVKLEGPYGTAYLRPNLPNRLVLVGSGTGFAPIWAIAEAALRENPMRKVVMITAARSYESLYMGPAARRVSGHPGVVVVPVADTVPEGVSDAVRRGRPTDHMPALRHDDIVYACGAPPMVDAVKAKALEVGAAFYADPFVPQPDESYEGVIAWVLDQLYHYGSPAQRLLPKPKPQFQERPRLARPGRPARRMEEPEKKMVVTPPSRRQPPHAPRFEVDDAASLLAPPEPASDQAWYAEVEAEEEMRMQPPPASEQAWYEEVEAEEDLRMTPPQQRQAHRAPHVEHEREEARMMPPPPLRQPHYVPHVEDDHDDVRMTAPPPLRPAHHAPHAEDEGEDERMMPPPPLLQALHLPHVEARGEDERMMPPPPWQTHHLPYVEDHNEAERMMVPPPLRQAHYSPHIEDEGQDEMMEPPPGAEPEYDVDFPLPRLVQLAPPPPPQPAAPAPVLQRPRQAVQPKPVVQSPPPVQPQPQPVLPQEMFVAPKPRQQPNARPTKIHHHHPTPDRQDDRVVDFAAHQRPTVAK